VINQKRSRKEKNKETKLLQLLNNIVNKINVDAARQQIENSKSLVACEKIPNAVLLPKSEGFNLKGENASVGKIVTQQTNLILEKARQKKVFK
jgi:hypothetical protein